MIMKLLSSIIIIHGSVLLAGCILNNHTVQDIEQTKYLRKEYSINKSLDNIESALYQYATNCRPQGNLMRNPAEKSKAKMIFSMVGWTDMSVIVVLDFWESEPNSTELKVYAYDGQFQHFFADKIIKAIESPGICN